MQRLEGVGAQSQPRQFLDDQIPRVRADDALQLVAHDAGALIREFDEYLELHGFLARHNGQPALRHAQCRVDRAALHGCQRIGHGLQLDAPVRLEQRAQPRWNPL